MRYIFNNCTLLIVLIICHELGHYLTALYFKKRITFTFTWGKLFNIIPIPRFIWYMPETFTPTQKAITAVAGFGAELLAVPIFYLCNCKAYAIIALLHLALYKFYAGESNDFKWLRS